jgi:hypothetical protein
MKVHKVFASDRSTTSLFDDDHWSLNAPPTSDCIVLHIIKISNSLGDGLGY